MYFTLRYCQRDTESHCLEFKRSKMEVLDYALATAQNLSYLVTQHPVYSTLGGVFLFICLVRFYCKLTWGVCTSDQDMSGKTVLITGASNGIGKVTAFDLARRNARVLLACRNIGKGNKVAEEIKSATGNQNVIVKCLELSSFESVRQCAKSVLETEDKLHVLINNAGIIGGSKKMTKDGCEIIMQTNHFGHFLLTALLLDLLKRSSPSRIINLSSIGHKFAKFDVEDLNNKRELNQFLVYCNSKLANVLFTRELSDRLRNTGVTVNSLHPGGVKTDLFTPVGKNPISILTEIVLYIGGKTPEEGAQTTIQLAVDPALEKTTGKYFSDCKEASVSNEAKNTALAKRLFELSEKIVGETF